VPLAQLLRYFSARFLQPPPSSRLSKDGCTISPIRVFSNRTVSIVPDLCERRRLAFFSIPSITAQWFT